MKCLCTVKPAMSSHSYEQPISYGRPLGHSPKWHFVYKYTSDVQPPAIKGHFSCVARVTAHSRFYCNVKLHTMLQIQILSCRPAFLSLEVVDHGSATLPRMTSIFLNLIVRRSKWFNLFLPVSYT